jgi:hypothetical protein
MRYDRKPVHRKLITPWYDSRKACLAVLLFMLAVFLFALVGVSSAWSSPLYRKMTWLPAALLLLSGAVALSTALRLVTRWRHRHARDHEKWS